MLNIARQIYAGYDTIPAGADDLPEAEIIPNGEAANEKRKIDKFTVSHKIVKEYENIPLPGFTLFKTNRAKWGSTDPTWLIIDPRGFLARITQENLEKILHVTGITEGLIQEPCVWARENTNTKMTLVPISSPSYVEAVKNTELIEGKVSLSDVQIGDTVLLQNGLKGTYLGILSLYAGLDNGGSSRKELKARSYLRRQIVQIDPNKFHFQTDVKILKVDTPAPVPLMKEQSMEIMNQSIAGGNSYFSSDSSMSGTRYFSRDSVRFTSVYATQSVNLVLEEIDKVEATQLFYEGQSVSDSGLFALESAEGKKYLIDHPWTFSSGPKNSISSFQASEIKEINKDKIVMVFEKSYYASAANGKIYSLDNFVKFYKIVKHVKTDSYV